VHTEDLIFYRGRRWKTVEDITELLPELYVVPSLAFIVEAIYPRDAGTFMVSAQQKHVLWILDLVSEQETHYLHGLLPAIDVVTKHEVVGVRREAASGEVLKQILELAMDISQQLDR